MHFFFQFPRHKSNTQQKKAVESTKQKRTGAGEAELLGSISLLGEIFVFLHVNSFPADSNST